MIEIIYNKEKESAVGNEEYFCVARNIRQIGQPSSDCKIYVEDYVYSYLSKDWKEEQTNGRIAILLGKCNWKEGVFYIFLKSTIIVENLEVTGEYISIKEDTWGKIYEEMKDYFPGQEVVGWYLSLPGGGLKITDLIKRVHLNHFGGNDKVLYLADPEEQDNAFFLYKNGRLEKQSGYYIFYEKNEQMQEYILEKNPKASVDFTGKAQDRAVSDFRKIIARKNEEKESRSSGKFFTFMTTGAAALTILLGAMWLRKVTMGDETVQNEVKNETIIESVQENTEGVTGDIISDTAEDVVNDITESEVQDPADLFADLQEDQDDLVESSLIQDTGAESSDAAAASALAGYTEYTIREGDTLSSISIRYYGDMSHVVEICKINSLKEEDTIYPGQKILLP